MDITFFRSALFSVCVLLSGCDSATTPTAPKSAATVLDGKTMGTFWRVSVIDLDQAKAEALAVTKLSSLTVTGGGASPPVPT